MLSERLIAKSHKFYAATVMFQLFAVFTVHASAPAELADYDALLSHRWRNASAINYAAGKNVPHQAAWMYVPASVMWLNDPAVRKTFYAFDTSKNATTEAQLEHPYVQSDLTVKSYWELQPPCQCNGTSLVRGWSPHDDW